LGEEITRRGRDDECEERGRREQSMKDKSRHKRSLRIPGKGGGALRRQGVGSTDREVHQSKNSAILNSSREDSLHLGKGSHGAKGGEEGRERRWYKK